MLSQTFKTKLLNLLNGELSLIMQKPINQIVEIKGNYITLYICSQFSKEYKKDEMVLMGINMLRAETNQTLSKDLTNILGGE
jgi:hypothetical protein